MRLGISLKLLIFRIANTKLYQEFRDHPIEMTSVVKPSLKKCNCFIVSERRPVLRQRDRRYSSKIGSMMLTKKERNREISRSSVRSAVFLPDKISSQRSPPSSRNEPKLPHLDSTFCALQTEEDLKPLAKNMTH